jgi:hypothetical protein
MPDLTIGMQEMHDAREATFEDFVELTVGHSVISAASWGPRRLELGMSGQTMLRIFWRPDGIEANVISTTNPEEVLSLTLCFDAENGPVPVRMLEEHLSGLRYLYAIARLVDSNRIPLLERALLSGSSFDLDDLLAPDEQLFVESSSRGSWYVTLWCKVRENYKSLLKVVSLVFDQGHDAFLRKLEAEAKLKELEAEERQFRLDTAKIDYGLGLIDKLSDKSARPILEGIVEQSICRALGSGMPEAEVKASVRRVLALAGPVEAAEQGSRLTAEQRRAIEFLDRHSKDKEK